MPFEDFSILSYGGDLVQQTRYNLEFFLEGTLKGSFLYSFITIGVGV
jgi:hypothetical protein